MNPLRLIPGGVAIFTLIAFGGCTSDDGDDSDPSNPSNPSVPGKEVKITSISDDYVFWGDHLTITGTGFSAVKDENIVTFVNSYPRTPELKLTSKDGDVEIISASETKITIRIPYFTENDTDVTHYRGEDYAQIEVAVKDKKDTTEQVKFIGLPRVGRFEYHYGWYDLAGVARSGDSVIIDGGFYGSKLGAGEKFPKEAGIYDKLQLSIDGIIVPIKYRKLTNSIHGFGLYLSPQDFSEVRCDEGELGWNERPMTFKFEVQGTEKQNSRTLYVTYLPKSTITSVDGPLQVLKGLGGNPYYDVEGKNMYYEKIRFVPTCTDAVVAESAIANAGTIHDHYQITIPLVLLEPCSYGVWLVSPCGETKHIASLQVLP